MKTKLLVICHGNTHRSPLAAAILAQSDLVEIRQGGVKPELKEGRRASKKVRDAVPCSFGEIASLMEDHRSRKVTQADIDWADYILFMDSGNLRRIKEQFGAVQNLRNLGNYINIYRIQDPAFVNENCPRFVAIIHEIFTSCEIILNKVASQEEL